ncbi:uncharacterized protein LOC128952049 [Oppia nitens]|uniref:uncharacterized protein LOC128952049 n=1 Tax=Oppia nitens TaxID=1686743 RepID=UPI0023DCCF9A|nr:uncharacterized protein LOC128952049 [Oppia nitens]
MPPLFRDSTSCNLLPDNTREKCCESCDNNTTTDPDNNTDTTTIAPISRVKCVLVGDGAIGKTSLIVSYTTNGYPAEYVPTAFDNYSVVVTIDNKPCQLQLCDTAGQDDFDTLRPLCYPQTNVFLLCFSVVCPTSFHNIQEKWLPEIKRYGNSKPPVILVGTQCDLRHDVKVLIELAQAREQPVSGEMAQRLANKIGAVKYIECSALTQKNLKDVFDTSILAGIEYEQQLRQKKSKQQSMTTKSPSILVSWGKAKSLKWLKVGGSSGGDSDDDHHLTINGCPNHDHHHHPRHNHHNHHHQCHSSSSHTDSGSTCCSLSSTTNSSSYSSSDQSLPPKPYSDMDDIETTSGGDVHNNDINYHHHQQHHQHPSLIHRQQGQPFYGQHSNVMIDISNNKSRLRKGWRRFCCGL